MLKSTHKEPSNIPEALRQLVLPDWMAYGYQSMRVPDEYWKYFPEHIQHRFELADSIEALPVHADTPMSLRKYVRRYLVQRAVLPAHARMRNKADGYGTHMQIVADYFGSSFVDAFIIPNDIKRKAQWPASLRAHRAPLEFAQSPALGNVWPEALIQRIVDENNYSLPNPMFAVHELTPEGKALEAYENECAAVREANEALDQFLRYLKKNVSRRPIRPMIIVRQFAVAPTEHDGLGWEQQRYDHTLYPRLEAFFGPRAWAFISSHYDKETRKHKTIQQQALVRHLDEDRPVAPPIPEQIKASAKPVVYDDYGQLIDVRFDQTLGCWVDDFGDPVEQIDNETQS